MRTTLAVCSGAALACGLLVLALWGWQHATRLAEFAEPTRPAATLLAVRSGALAIGALAQVVLLTLVVGRLYPRQLFDDVLRFGAGLVATLAVVGAIVLGFVGR